jgi:signal transduction histidine kinase
MFSASFIYLQRLNQKAEQALSDSLQNVRAQKQIIERQKREDQEIAALALEKQREANAMKSTFVAITSHEFRTPLAAILSAQELLRDFGDRMTLPEREELFVVIHSSVQRMTGMLDKVLILSQADADLMGFKPRQLDVADFCRRLVGEALKSSNGADSQAPRIALQLQIPDGELARMDESLLRHSLSNLLSNAIKYSPDGAEVVLEVSKQPEAMRFDVIDHGIGVPEEDMPRLFDPFHRASNVDGIPGTGLGLAIAKRAVERHGGTIDVASTVGRGTRFRVWIPHG